MKWSTFDLVSIVVYEAGVVLLITQPSNWVQWLAVGLMVVGAIMICKSFEIF